MGNCITSSTLDNRLVPGSSAPFRERRRGDGPGPEGPRGPEQRGAGAALPGAPLIFRRRILFTQSRPREVYGRDECETKTPECAICLMDLVSEDPIRSLPCKHVYHLDCINEWLTRSFTCPLCRGPVEALQPGPLM